MADIFLSYASGNRRKISVLVGLFENLGWSVWGDRNLNAGQEWSESIEIELEQARCTVVAWSRASISSDWVLREARIGKDRNVLVPILLEPVEPPPEFSAIQAARLTAWAESSQSEELDKLLRRLSAVLGSGSESVEIDLKSEVAAEMSRVEVAEAALEYAAAFVLFHQQRDASSKRRLQPAYSRLSTALSPISDEDFHELIERYLKIFAA